MREKSEGGRAFNWQPGICSMASLPLSREAAGVFIAYERHAWDAVSTRGCSVLANRENMTQEGCFAKTSHDTKTRAAASLRQKGRRILGAILLFLSQPTEKHSIDKSTQPIAVAPTYLQRMNEHPS